MSVEGWIALGVLVVTVATLVTGRVPTLIVLGAALATMVFADVAEPDIALSGMSSRAPVTIAALYIVAGAATATGLFTGVVDRILVADRSIGPLVGLTAALSTFIPNTPLVAMFAPQVVRWADRHRADMSRYLLPMSFASILGGIVLLFGTSTNLVVSDRLAATGEEPLGVLEVTAVGLPVALVGVLLLSTIVPRLLPRRPSPQPVSHRARQFQVALRVAPAGRLVGQSIEDAGLRDLDGTHLRFLERPDGDRLVTVPATPDTPLHAGDICCFVGDTDGVLDLHDIDGLTPALDADGTVVAGAGAMVYEAVVAPLSTLNGRSLRASGFRGRYGGAVMAIHRADEELSGQLGRIRLRPGDVLLILADEEFGRRYRGHGDFSLVAAVDRPPPRRQGRAPIIAAIFTAFVATATTGVLSLLEASVAAAIAVVIVGALSISEAGRAVNLDVVLTMAVAIGLGASIQASGLADEIAALVERLDGFGDTGLVLATLVAAIALSELLTNTAAAVMLPIALAIAQDAGAQPRMLAITVLFGASCSFLSPIGYQTNLMVVGLGGHRFTDFTRAGAPLTVATVVVVTALVPVVFG